MKLLEPSVDCVVRYQQVAPLKSLFNDHHRRRLFYFFIIIILIWLKFGRSAPKAVEWPPSLPFDYWPGEKKKKLPSPPPSKKVGKH